MYILIAVYEDIAVPLAGAHIARVAHAHCVAEMEGTERDAELLEGVALLVRLCTAINKIYMALFNHMIMHYLNK